MAKSRKVKIILGLDVTEAERQVKSFSYKLESLGGKADRFGSALVKLTAPLALLGGMAIKSAFHIDEAFDTLAVKSGATGRELENLKQDFKSLAPQVTQPFEATAEVLGDLYTRLNLSGEGLQSMGRAALDAGRLLKEDLTSVVAGSTRVMKDWGVANEQGTILLDKLFLAGQKTGAGLGQLSEELVRYGAPMRQLGFNLDTATALLAEFERQGVNTELVMGSLRIALSKMAKSGIKDTAGALDEAIQKIKTAGSVGEANARAIEVFGAKAGPDMAAAIREGRFEVAELTKALQGAEGAIRNASKETDGFAEKWDRLKNKIGIALEPVGTQMMTIGEDWLQPMSKAIDALSGSFGTGAIKTGLFLTALGAGIKVGGWWISTFGKMTKAASGLSGWLVVVTSKMGKWIVSLPEAIRSGAGFTGWLLAASGGLSKVADGLALLATRLQFVLPLLAAFVAYQMGKEVLKGTDSDTMYTAPVGGPNSTRNTSLTKGERRENTSAFYEKLEAQRLANLGSPFSVGPGAISGTGGSGGALGGSSSGESAVESLVSKIRDQMAYLGADGKDFLSLLDQWQKKLAPLSEDWKKIADLQKDIRSEMSRIAGEETAAAFKRSESAVQADELKRAEKSAVELKQLAQDVNDGISAFYDTQAWGNRLGLLGDPEYLDSLTRSLASMKAELADIGLDPEKFENWTEPMRERFAEVQDVMGKIASTSLDTLAKQFENGTLSAEGYREALSRLLEQYGDYPQVTKNIEGAMTALDDTLRATTVSMSRLIREADKALNDQLASIPDTLAGAFAGAIARGEDLGDMLRSLGQDIAYLFIKAMALRLLGGLFGGLFGGRAIGKHSGGIVGEDSPTFVRSLPRFHSGGIVGSDERLAILQTGEGVFSRKQMQALGDGMGGQTNITIQVKAIDAQGVKDFFEKNRGAVEGIVTQNLWRNGKIRTALQSI